MSFLFVHSITEDKLLKSLELGGFPLPSIAVIKPNTAFSNFGDITFIIKPEVLNPKDNKNIFYDRDIFSQRIPETEYQVNKKELGKVIDEIYYKINGFDKFYNFNDVESLQRKSSSYIQERFESSMILKKEYFLEQNKDYQIPVKKSKLNSILSESEGFSKFIKNNDISLSNDLKEAVISALKDREEYYSSLLGSDIAKDIIKEVKDSIFKKDTYEFKDDEYSLKNNKTFNGIKKDKNILNGQSTEIDIDKFKTDILDFTFENIKYFKVYLNEKYLSRFLSKPHFKIGNKKYDYNLENIEKIMKKQDLIGAEDVTDTSVGKISSHFARKLSSFQDIEDNIYLLKDKEDRFDKKDSLNNKIFNIANDLSDIHDSKRFFDIQESLCISLTQGSTKESLVRSLINNGFEADKIKEETINDCLSVVRELIELDNHYFEGKPQKTIYIEDCEAVLLPLNTNKDIIKKLKGKVKIHFYDKDRIETKMEIFEDHKFDLSKKNDKKIKKSLTIK